MLVGDGEEVVAALKREPRIPYPRESGVSLCVPDGDNGLISGLALACCSPWLALSSRAGFPDAPWTGE